VLGKRPDVQHLTGVIPLVEGLVGVDALVTLQPDQPPAENRRHDLGDLGLADPDLAFEQDGPVQRQRDEQRRGQPAVSQVTTLPQDLGQLADGLRGLHVQVLLAAGIAESLFS
jgi:hypothetical protein